MTNEALSLRDITTLIAPIETHEIDAGFVITHRAGGRAAGPEMYETFRDKKDGCITVVMRPHG